MGNHFSFTPADDLETFSHPQCSNYSFYTFKFKLTCAESSFSTCSFNGLSVSFLSYCGLELENFVEFSSFSTVDNKCFKNVTTSLINDEKTLKINFDIITVPVGQSVDVVLRFKIKKLPCQRPIKIKLETDGTELLSGIIRIYELPCNQCCKTC